MNQALYIKAASCISAQHSYDTAQFLQPVISNDGPFLQVLDQDYSKYISPVAIRRMSRLLKMSITTGMQCLSDAGVQPDAIITGTGRGSVSDMEHFLHDMIEFKEEALNPTYFIQSTYNSVNGWLALQTKCTKYNQTYVHRGLSFELALLDAQLTLSEAATTQNILVGGFDEMTAYYHFVKSKIGYWKQQKLNSLDLFKHSDTVGTIGGEGASFFVLSNDSAGSSAVIKSVQALHRPSPSALAAAIRVMLATNGIALADIDVLLSGMSGNVHFKAFNDGLAEMLTANTTIAAFKHLSGEFDTANGFGLWLANYMLSNQTIPEATIIKQGDSKRIKHILLYNQAISGDASIMLLEANVPR